MFYMKKDKFSCFSGYDYDKYKNKITKEYEVDYDDYYDYYDDEEEFYDDGKVLYE